MLSSEYRSTQARKPYWSERRRWSAVDSSRCLGSCPPNASRSIYCTSTYDRRTGRADGMEQNKTNLKPPQPHILITHSHSLFLQAIVIQKKIQYMVHNATWPHHRPGTAYGDFSSPTTRCSLIKNNTNLLSRKLPERLRNLATLKFCACLWRFSGRSPSARPWWIYCRGSKMATISIPWNS
jgi:hypothetical protein